MCGGQGDRQKSKKIHEIDKRVQSSSMKANIAR